MGRKSKKPQKQETVSMANLEVISAENFQRRLDGINSRSCFDCMRERAKDASEVHSAHKRRKASHVRLNAPIMVRLQDTIKISVKNRLKQTPKSSDQESDQSSDDGLPCKKETVSLNNIMDKMDKLDKSKWNSLRGDKNFNAFLSAIERVHLKDHGSLSANLENLEEFVRSTKEKHGSFLNNSINFHSSISDKDHAAIRRGLEFLEKDNIDLICNDLSSKSSTIDSEDNPDDSEHSENSSVISSTEDSSQSDDSDLSSDSQSDDLSSEELERLTEYTSGFSLTRYDCPPHECPQCLAAYYSYMQTCHTSQQDAADSDSTGTDDLELADVWACSRENCAVKVLHKGKVEVSLGSLFAQRACQQQHSNNSNPRREYHFNRRRKNFECYNSVYVDVSEMDVAFSVQYHQMTENTDGSPVGAMNLPDWYMYPYGIMGCMPVALPYYLMPIYYMPFPLYTMPKPICVPRNTRCLSSSKLCMVPAHEVKSFTTSQPPQRPWIPLAHPERIRPVAIFTVMCYNVLCDKYATRQLYGYCPSWALNWEYRKKGIIEEIRHYSADIITLQEVETDQFYNFFLPELKRDGYDGIFSPKSRARTMTESERKHVDGCAIFFRTSKFSLLKEQLIEFNQLAMASADGSHDMLNRVMTKDNIGLTALLETKDQVWENGLPPDGQTRVPVLVATCHIHWDPEFSDVKLVQTMMLMSELKNIIEDSQTSLRPRSSAPDCNSIPLLLCGDLNSLPESGVVEFLNSGRVSARHEDFKDIGYDACLTKLNSGDNKDYFMHGFRLGATYSKDCMPYTNYTFDFKGIIDYVFASRDWMRPLGVLGPLDDNWFSDNKVIGAPHPHLPSDHLPLLCELEMAPTPINAPQQVGRGGPSGPHLAARR